MRPDHALFSVFYRRVKYEATLHEMSHPSQCRPTYKRLQWTLVGDALVVI
jgi:hypothetical protein